MAKIQTKHIKDFIDYSVNTQGELFSHKTGEPKLIKGSISQGYSHVKLSNGDTLKSTTMHRLVAETFLPKPKGKNIVNHLDGNKLNNNVSNLEWTNNYGNMKHYSEKLAPVYKIKKVKAKQDKIDAKMSVIDHAYSIFKDDAESFAKVYAALR